jgi:hypothetical protein
VPLTVWAAGVLAFAALGAVEEELLVGLDVDFAGGAAAAATTPTARARSETLTTSMIFRIG